MDLFNLRARLTLDKSDYEKGIKEVKEENSDFSEKTKKQIGVIAADAWLNLASKVIDVGKKITQTSLDTINYADNIGDLAGKWGFTTKEIQEFDYWATMNGTTLESLLTGMRGLVNQAEAGANAFKVLGVNVKNNDGTLKSQKQLFLETLDALQKMPNQTERNALQFEIFGRAGIELGQVISRSREELEGLSTQAEEFGLIMDEDVIDKAGHFNDVLDRLKKQGQVAFAGLLTGAEGAEQEFDEYIQNVIMGIELLAPILTEAGTKLIGAFFKGLITGIGGKIWEQIQFIFGKGWLWGEKTINNAGEFFSQALFMDKGFFGGTSATTPTSIFNKQETSSSNTDNSKTEITINMESSGYTSEDAKKLAEEVIKEIATKKQASGR